MGVMEILFEVPGWISEGLKNGDLTRHGGVIWDSNGKIRYHLRELGSLDNPQSLLGGLDKAGAQLAGLQQMQMLNLAGLGAVAVICVAGFLWLGHKMNLLQAEMESVARGVAEVQATAARLEQKDFIKRADGYFRAGAAYQERDWQAAFTNARDCSAEIQNYLVNLSAEELLTKEEEFSFLLQTLGGCLRIQLACADFLGEREKIAVTVERYERIFAALQEKIGKFRVNCRKSLPTSATLPLLKKFGNPESSLCKLADALPVALEMLTNERRFISLCSETPREKIESAVREGKKYILVSEPIGEAG